MTRVLRAGTIFGLAALASALAGCASGSNADVAADTNDRVLDARAETHLKRMCAFLAAKPALSFASDILYEDYLVEDRKVQVGRSTSIEFRRPNMLRGQVAGDTERRQYRYDGKQVSILDETSNVYARLDVPGTYDEMFTAMREKYGVNMVLGELLLSDPYRDLISDVREGAYIGIRTIGGARCHHLLFSQKTLDWQIWIDAGEQPWPRKLVVTYKALPACPQFSATFTRWEAAASPQDADYAFVPPTNAVEVDEIEPLPSVGSTMPK